MDDYENCPMCGETFSIEKLISHASSCEGKGSNNNKRSEKNDPMEVEDEDLKLALQLSDEEEKRTSSSNKRSNSQLQSDEDLARKLFEEERSQTKSESSVKCQLCNQPVSNVDDLYILDECTHKFCKDCIRNYVSEKIQTSVNLECPLSSCKKPLSVRDMNDLLPKIKKTTPGFLDPKKGTGKATERILSELKHIMKADPEKNGYSVETINDNLYHWELKLFNFDKTDPLGQDMAASKTKSILLHIVFPSNYPFSPPYIRVIRPRFQYRTGHVTIGGSICMEVLTNKGWSPANTIEAIIVSIRAQLIEGGARLDRSNKSDYTQQEAKEAFERMVRDHGWF